MNKLLKRCIALIFAVIMMVAYTDMDAFAIQITGNAIVYIKATSTNNYLYADGNTVKFGAKKANDSKYVWSIEKKGNEYWIKNNGTNTYMCLENEGGQTGTVRLEGTIYDVWESCRWYISGNATSSTIQNMWKKENGYVSTGSNSTAVFGTTKQQWVFEQYGSSGSGTDSSSTTVTDDGKTGKLNNKTAASAISIPAADASLNKYGATMPYTRYDSEKATLGGGATLAKNTNWSLTDILRRVIKSEYKALERIILPMVLISLR